MNQESDSDHLLIGDAEREQAQERLREACVDGRLTLAEFSVRVETALTARTQGQIREITRDLGRVPAVFGSTAISRVYAIVSERKCSGPWRVAGQVDVVAVMGNCKIDLRDAEISGGEVVLNLSAVMSDVKIRVPSGLLVVMEETSLLSSSKDMRSGTGAIPGSPVVRVRGFGLMSSIEITDADGNGGGW